MKSPLLWASVRNIEKIIGEENSKKWQEENKEMRQKTKGEIEIK
jgi:hypothetical protein